MSIEYYNKNAKDFYSNTYDLNLKHLYKIFLKYVPSNAHILDAGCGSGRDSIFFLSQGFKVTSIDASKELVSLASKNIGKEVLVMRFQDMNFKNIFDAIWACASLLHITKNEIIDVFGKLLLSLNNNGIIYASFKYGNDERLSQTRLFNDYNEISFSKLIKNIPCLKIEEIWKTPDFRENRKNEYWLNLILKKIPEVKK